MSESDSSSRKSNEPSQDEPASETITDTAQDLEAQKLPVRSEAIEQGRKFLEHDEVKNTSTEKKISFLEHKGLSREEIDSSVKRVDEAASSLAPTSPLENVLTNTSTEKMPAVTKPASQAPIVTYPEFLTNPSATQPPILSARSLLTTVYAISVSTATLHGTHLYAKSMLDKLGECRHEFFSATLSKLESFSTKLESVVSEMPPGLKEIKNSDPKILEDGENDMEPTALFHRDIGIQTSLPPSSNGLSPVTSTQPTQPPLIYHSSRLASINSSLHEIAGTLDGESKSSTELESTTDKLRSYLNTLAYPLPPNIGYGNLYHGSGQGINGEIDLIREVKREIMGMKGLLLSARSFPGAVNVKSGALTK